MINSAIEGAKQMKSDKLWAGRFAKNTAADVHRFNRSIDFDFRLYRQDIQGSLAHAAMLEKVGLLNPEELTAIRSGLLAIQDEIESGSLPLDPAAEDIHMFIEAELTRRIGEAGKKLHTGRSRNDQVAVDIRLYIRDEAAVIKEQMQAFLQVLLDLAEKHLDTILPGYTHLQRAQPVTFAHHLMAYVQMFLRDLERLNDALARMDECPLGAAALAGSGFPLDREFVAHELGFSRISANSMDAVSDRDFAIEIVGALTLFMLHISRLSEEIILWNSREFAFIELDDAYATGSSIMPQKKNPDVAELARGKAARIIGQLNTLLSLMKNLPLAYNKDMQEDKEAIFSAIDTIKLTLPPYIGMLATLSVNKEKMLAAAEGGFTNATEVADYLAAKGLAFREAHHVSGRLVQHCLAEACTLAELNLETFRSFSHLFEEDIYEAIALQTAIAKRSLPGGPAIESEKKALAEAKRRLYELIKD